MASYLYFVYVKENDHNKLDYNTIDTKDFKIVTSDKPVNNINSKEVCRRVRNAISHGSFIVDNELITLEDNNSSQTDHIKLEINIVKFGEFISNFANEVHSQLSGI
jgi:hypothetical protein